MFSKYPVTSDEVYISADIDALDLVYSLLSNAAKVQELATFYKDSAQHRDRAEYIKGILKSLNISELFKKKVRNTVEHFAEYLDEANKNHTLFRNPQRYFVAYNLVISHWTVLNTDKFPFQLYKTPQLELPLYPVRIYISSQRKFYNMDWSIDLNALSNEARLIKEHMKDQKYFKEETPEDWASGMTVC